MTDDTARAAQRAPEPATAERAGPRTLPRPHAPLVGRSEEVKRALNLLRSGDVRLLTLTGRGGVGKTRTAVEIARDIADDFAGGAVLVELADITETTAVVSAIARAIGVAPAPGESQRALVIQQLGVEPALLLLDNFEHLLDGASQVPELLDECPELRVLATSRGPLQVRGEHVIRLGPLELPPVDVDGARALASYASVELFSQRAAAVNTSFEITDDNAAAIAEVCRQVDGVPLAIELAAARTTALTPRALVAQMEMHSALDLAANGPRDLPERQRDLRETLAWSYGLLTPDEQQLLRDLTVFDGSFAFAAVEAVRAGAAAATGTSALDGLTELVDWHLVEPAGPTGDEPRFWLMPTIRAFAREQQSQAEHETVRAAHTEHYREIARETSLRIDTAQGHLALAELEREYTNLVAVLGRLTTENRTDDALQLASDLAPLWLHRGDSEAAMQWFQTLPTDTSEPDALLWAALFEFELRATAGVDPVTFNRMERGVELARAGDDPIKVFRGLSLLVHMHSVLGDFDRASDLAGEGGALTETEPEPWWSARFMTWRAVLANQGGDLDAAARYGSTAIRQAREIGDTRLLLRSALVVLSLPPDHYEPDPLVPPLEDLLGLARTIGDVRCELRLLAKLAATAAVAGELEDAASWCAQALMTVRRAGYWHAAGVTLISAVVVAFFAKAAPTAARLHGTVVPHMELIERAIAPGDIDGYRLVVEAVRSQCGAEEFDRLVAQGTGITWDGAIQEALVFMEGLTRARRSRRSPNEHADPLTARELDVLRLIAAGGTNKDIARELNMAPKTVMHHSSSIYRKLGVRGRAEAAAHAVRHALLPPP